METDVSQDFQDYWNEYRIVTSEEKLSEDDNHNSQSKSDDEGLDEAEWLVLAGLSHLTDSYLRGQEIEETELEPVMNVLSLHQANAVRRRVHSLNQTVKHRPRMKHKKPDIRDVFKNLEDIKPTATISSNDSEKNDRKIYPDSHFPPFSSLPDYININCTTNVIDPKISLKEENLPSRREIFRRVIKTDKDVVASENADGITMLAFQRFGTVRDTSASKNCYQSSVVTSDQRGNTTTEAEEENLDHIKEPNNTHHLGFEYMWQQPTNWKSEVSVLLNFTCENKKKLMRSAK